MITNNGTFSVHNNYPSQWTCQSVNSPAVRIPVGQDIYQSHVLSKVIDWLCAAQREHDRATAPRLHGYQHLGPVTEQGTSHWRSLISPVSTVIEVSRGERPQSPRRLLFHQLGHKQRDGSTAVGTGREEQGGEGENSSGGSRE